MQYKEKLTKDEFKEAHSGLVVKDGKGNTIYVSLDFFGNLEINAPYGKVRIIPEYTNQVTIEVKEDE